MNRPPALRTLMLSLCLTLGATGIQAQRAPDMPTSIGDPLKAGGATTEQSSETITIVLVGDTGFSRNHSPVNPLGVQKYGKLQPFSEALAGIATEIDGDINFANIETVVTDRNNLDRDTKEQKAPFSFRSHPNGIRQLVRTGFNLFSLSNNHAMDYGSAGLDETLRHVAKMTSNGLLAHAGIGHNREQASRPHVVRTKGATIGFAAIGIASNNLQRHRAGPNKPGQVAYRVDADFDEVTNRLAKTPADFRMLSIHYGIEGQVRTDATQIADWRRLAAGERGIDLIVGHHAHVARGVETNGDAIIFYGLGNFLHHGMADMGGSGLCRDYGLLARVHLTRSASGNLAPGAIEAIPVSKMHIRTERFASPLESHKRIYALNYLAALLDNEADQARGIRFTPQADGSGLYCFAGAKGAAGKIGKLCRSWQPAKAIPAALRSAVVNSCKPRAAPARAPKGKLQRPQNYEWYMKRLRRGRRK